MLLLIEIYGELLSVLENARSVNDNVAALSIVLVVIVNRNNYYFIRISTVFSVRTANAICIESGYGIVSEKYKI